MLNYALKMIREFHQIKQNELANQLEISKSYLSEIESSKKTISLELLEKYSEIFDIPVSSIMLFSEEIENENPVINKIRRFSVKKVLKIMEWVNKNDNKN